MEFVGDGVSVKMGLEGWRRWRVRNGDEKRVDGMDGVGVLLRRIGMAVGRLHAKGFVHGDLTSSNLMLRSEHGSVDEGPGEETCLSGEVVLIDFGLASTSCQEEDRAVDLYVLERAMGSTHPWLEAEFGLMLDGYRTSYKGASATLKRLEEVRMRGRKRSMLG